MSPRKSKRLGNVEPTKTSPLRTRLRKLRSSEDFAKTPHEIKLHPVKRRGRGVRVTQPVNEIFDETIDNVRPSRSSVENTKPLRSALKKKVPSASTSLFDNKIDTNTDYETDKDAAPIENKRRSTFELEKSTVDTALLPDASIIDLTESICEVTKNNKENNAANNSTFEINKSAVSPKRTPAKQSFRKTPAKVKLADSIINISENQNETKNNSTFEIDEPKTPSNKKTPVKGKPSFRKTPSRVKQSFTENANSTTTMKNGTFKYNTFSSLPRKTPARVKFSEIVQTKQASANKNNSTFDLGELGVKTRKSIDNSQNTENTECKNNSTFDMDQGKAKGTPNKNNSTFELKDSSFYAGKANDTKPVLNDSKLRNRSIFNVEAGMMNTPRFASLKELHFNTPPSNTSTPALDKGLLSKKKHSSVSEKILKPKLGITKPSTKKKMPNFALMHLKAYERMESADDYIKRKQERAKLLLSGLKSVSKIDKPELMDMKLVKAKKQLPFEATTKENTNLEEMECDGTPSKKSQTKKSPKKQQKSPVETLSPIKKLVKVSPIKMAKTFSPIKARTPVKQSKTPNKPTSNKSPLKKVVVKKVSPLKQLTNISPVKKLQTATSAAKPVNVVSPIKQIKAKEASKITLQKSPVKKLQSKIATPVKGLKKQSPEKKLLINKFYSKEHLKHKEVAKSPLRKAVIGKPVVKPRSPIKFGRIPSKENIDVRKNVISKKDQQIKSIATKSHVAKPADKQREAIKGVRSNRRFELLMKMRNIK